MAQYVIGGLLLLVGTVWMGQGAGYIKGSFMTGQIRWFWIGLATSVLGLVVVAWTSQRRRS